MDCCPVPAGSERHVIEPFVLFLNRQRGLDFRHSESLDKIHRNSPKPETLYIDLPTQSKMVIEHKTLVWPHDYSKWHSSDHDVSNSILRGIRPLVDGRSYQLTLPHCIRGTKDELKSFVMNVVSTIRARWPEIESGKNIGAGKTDTAHWWRFRRLERYELDLDESEGGIRVQWPSNDSRWNKPEAIPQIREILHSQLQRCIAKFKDYPDLNKIVLVQIVSDLSWIETRDWKKILDGYMPPQGIDEIWFADNEWITDYEKAWAYTRLYPDEVVKFDDMQRG